MNERIEATARSLEESARAAEMWISGDGRVTEPDAATLLGLAHGSLANMRSAGVAPAHYHVGRITYRVLDLATWIEATRAR